MPVELAQQLQEFVYFSVASWHFLIFNTQQEELDED
jgi:hypothetical protein